MRAKIRRKERKIRIGSFSLVSFALILAALLTGAPTFAEGNSGRSSCSLIYRILANPFLPSKLRAYWQKPWEQHPYWQTDSKISFANLYEQIESTNPLPNAKPSLEDLMKSTIGYEIEGHVSQSLDLNTFSKKASQAFVPEFGEFHLEQAAPDAVSFTSSRGPKLAFKRDDTIEPPAGRQDVEINFPEISYDRYHSLLHRVLTDLKQSDFRYTKTSGIHIHVGFPYDSVSSSELVLMNDVLHVLQKDLFQLFSPRTERSRYIYPIGSVERNFGLTYRVKYADLLTRPISGNPAMLAKTLSLPDGLGFVDITDSLAKHKTIQLRLLNGSFDVGQIEIATDFLARLIWTIHYRDPLLRNYLITHSPAEINLKDVIRILNAPRKE